MKTFVAALLLTASLALAQDAADLAPADTNVFIEIRDVTSFYEQWQGDPLMAELLSNLPAAKNPEVWAFIEAALDMTSEEIFETYFSQQLVVIAEDPGDGEPAVLFSRIKPDDAQRVINGLLLMKIDTIGEFDIYEPEDRSSRFAFGGEWMAIAEQWHEPFMLRVLESMQDQTPLSNDPEFLTWTGKLPSDRQATAFVRKNGDLHALAMDSNDAHMTLSYAGKSQKFAKMLTKLADAETLSLAPAPSDALMAIALNIYDTNPRDTAVIDRLLTPKTFKDDVLPGLAAPMVMWISEDPADPQAMPAMAMAVRLSDASVTPQIDHMFQTLVTFANVAGLQWGLPPITTTQKTVGETNYMHTQSGAALAQRTGIDMLANLDFAFGPTGDWYCVTTHPALLENVVTKMHTHTAAAPVASRTPVARMQMQSSAMATHIERIAGELSVNKDPKISKESSEIQELATWLSHYGEVQMSLDADDQGALYSTVEITRP